MNTAAPVTSPSTIDAPDPLEFEIFRHSVRSIVDEIEVNLTRTAYSELLYDYKDYCVGIVDREFRLLAQSEGSIPVFGADLGKLVEDSVGIIGLDQLGEGDIFVNNYAPVGGQHLNNVVCASPIFDCGTIVAYIAIRAHWMDLGGLTPGSVGPDAREIYHEGIQYRGLRVVVGGRVLPEVLATIAANSRQPESVVGDMMAQVAGCTLGRERWRDRVAGRWSPDRTMNLLAVQSAHSARLGREAVESMPDGTYEASGWLDSDGTPDGAPIPLHLKVIVSGGRFTIDFSGLPLQTETPFNSGRWGGAESVARCAFKGLFAPDEATDHWLFESLEVVIPPGRLLSAEGAAPMGFWSTPLPTIIDLIYRAIGEKWPERVAAGHHGTMAAMMFTGYDTEGRVWMQTDTCPGGMGAYADGDGFGPVRTLIHADNRGLGVELTEARYPLRYVQNALRPEAGGDGKYKGGPGIDRTVEALAPMRFTSMLDRTIDPPWGLAGGLPGTPGELWVKRSGDAEWREANRAAGMALESGALVRIRTAGGGGWGAPSPSAAPPTSLEGIGS